MGLFDTPEEKAEKQRQKSEADFWASPVGQARRARAAGAKMFQIDISISKTSGWSNWTFGTHVSNSAAKNAAGVIEQIEDEGWRLEHVGYVYRVTGSVSTGKMLGSGEREVNSGEIVGIYIFRVTQAAAERAGA
jgi:hypothetical protein